MEKIVDPIKKLINNLIKKIVGVPEFNMPSKSDLLKIVGIKDKIENLKKNFSESDIKKAINRLWMTMDSN